MTYPNIEIDPATAQRLLDGSMGPDDAPPAYAAVAALLRDASAPAGVDPARELATVSMMAGTIHRHPRRTPTIASRRSPVLSKLLSAKLAAAALGGGLTLTTGLGAAGALPGPAQTAVADVLERVGVVVPAGHDHDARREARETEKQERKAEKEAAKDAKRADKAAEKAEKAAERAARTAGGSTADDRSGPSENAGPSERSGSNEHGKEISNLARTTDATGAEKGAVISERASRGRSQAGENRDRRFESRPSDDSDDDSNDTVDDQGRRHGGRGADDTVDDSDTHDDSRNRAPDSGGNRGRGRGARP